MNKTCWGVILAAGQGSRLATATGGTAKQFLHYRGLPLWWHSVKAMAACPHIHGLVLVFPPDKKEESEAELRVLEKSMCPKIPLSATCGGARRQDSVRLGLASLPQGCTFVLVHDSARPFVSTPLVSHLVLALKEHPNGVIPGVAMTDTIKEVNEARDVTRTPERDRLWAVQTPQAFPLEALREAHARAQAEGWEVTDDASLMERCGHRIHVIEGDMRNIKITHPQDLNLLNESKTELPCCGYGYDVHAYGGDRPLILGGITVGGPFLLRAHSDGDVLLHALMDAILGCFGGGDIGQLFPDEDPRFEGVSSAVLLNRVLELATESGIRLVHADLTVIAQKPHIAPFAIQIQRNVAQLLNLPLNHVGFKATTEENLGFTGELLGLKAVALVTAMRRHDQIYG